MGKSSGNHIARFVVFLSLMLALFVFPELSKFGIHIRFAFMSEYPYESSVSTDEQTDRGAVLSAVAQVDPADPILYDDIYAVYDGSTVVVTEKKVGPMYRMDCVPWMTCSLSQLPCVNVTAVEDYVRDNLAQMLDDHPETDIAANSKGKFEYRLSDTGPDVERLVTDIVSLLTARAEAYASVKCSGGHVETYLGNLETRRVVRVQSTEVPGTNGGFSDKYIEIDDSQQHLYLWEQGELSADHEVSGFYDEYAVFGVFTIREKSPKAWSPIAEKWMPWWMAFHYDPKQAAWFGIHELVWWVDENGVYHEESEDSIGQKKSGGCVRLNRGEAEELYNKMSEGDFVIIHP